MTLAPSAGRNVRNDPKNSARNENQPPDQWVVGEFIVLDLEANGLTLCGEILNQRSDPHQSKQNKTKNTHDSGPEKRING